MGGVEVIKQFLVGLGFGVDDGELASFTKALASASLKVTALYVSIQAMSAIVFKSITGIADDFEKFGYEARLIAPAINKTLMLRKAMLEAYGRAGIDIQKVVKQSVLFNFSLAKTKFALDALYKSVGSRFIPLLTQQLDMFRGNLYKNLPKIQAQLEKFIKFLFKAFEATVHLGGTVWSILGRVWDFFSKLDDATNGWSTKILLAVAAWKLLNLAFLASPLGIILTGLLAILALYDDFKTFQEGGESLIDWNKYLPTINAVSSAISTVVDTVTTLYDAFSKLFSGDFSGFFEGIEGYVSGLVKSFGMIQYAINSVIDSILRATGLMSGLSKVGSFVDSGIQGVKSLFGGSGAAPALSSVSQPGAPLVGGGGTQQSVRQETNINVQGSPDANSTARAVSSEQSKVNFDMTRNLRGASR